jgi:hypothetical protein
MVSFEGVVQVVVSIRVVLKFKLKFELGTFSLGNYGRIIRSRPIKAV